MLIDKNVFYDSDCLVCFLVAGCCDILQQLFSKVIVPLNVKEEIMNPVTPSIIKENFNKLLKIGFIEIKELIINTEEYNFYNEIKNNHFKNKPSIGDGEAAVIALTYKNGGIIASNNLSDVVDYVKEYDLNLITTAFILAKSYEKHIKTEEELNEIWLKMIQKGRKRSLPKADSFDEYYSTYYHDDCKLMRLE